MKILILTSRFGMGHYSAACNLEEEIKESDKQAEVFVEDIYEAIFPEYCELLYGAYSTFISRGWKLYNFAYKKATETEPSQKKAGIGQLLKGRSRLLTNAHFMNAIEDLIHKKNPDVIIATYSLCAKLVSEYKASTGSRIPLITCITDVTAHNIWANQYTDHYLVASRATKAELMTRGVEVTRIHICGIPVRAEFRKPRWEYVSVNKELLIMGGGLGLLPRNEEFYRRLARVPGLKTTVITGNNKKLYKRLHGKYENVQVLGHTDQVHEYMRKADLIISKPGGLTLFETIYMELPMVVFSPFLEQEIKNGEFIEKHGLGKVLEAKPEESIREIIDMINDTAALERIRYNMRRMKKALEQNVLVKVLEDCIRSQNSEINGKGQDSQREVA